MSLRGNVSIEKLTGYSIKSQRDMISTTSRKFYDVEEIAERMFTAIGNPRLPASRTASTGHPDEEIEQPLLCECDW